LVTAEETLQIYDLHLRSKLASYHAPSAVLYCHWLSPTLLSFVTNNEVYHWAIEGNNVPQKMFERQPTDLTGPPQVVNYQVSEDGKWCLLCVIAPGGQRGTIDGCLQVHSVDKGATQVLQGHNGVFATVTPPGHGEAITVLISVLRKPNHSAKLCVTELRSDQHAPAGAVFRVPPQAVPYVTSAGTAEDFPAALVVANRHDMVWLVSKQGYVFLFDLFTAKAVCRAKVSQTPLFAAVQHAASDGVLAVARGGQVLLLRVKDEALLPYITIQLNDAELAAALAARLNLAGCEELYAREFHQLLVAGKVSAAIELAVKAPNRALRTPSTMQALHGVPAVFGQPSALQQYLTLVLEAPGALTHEESMEVVHIAVEQGQGELLGQWLAQDKLHPSEDMGDLIIRHDAGLALGVYLAVGANDKACASYYLCGRYGEMVEHATRTRCRADYAALLSQLIASDTAAAVDLAVKLTTSESGYPLLDMNLAIDAFVAANLLRDCTAFLLEALRPDSPRDAGYQTRALEINFLGGYPQVAEAMLNQRLFSHYNKAYIGGLCARYGLADQAQRHEVYILQDQTAAILRHIRCAPQVADWLWRRESLHIAYHRAKESVPRDFFLISDLGKQRDIVLAEGAVMPITEGEYKTLAERYREVVQMLTEQCERCTKEERFKDVRVLATLLQRLKDVQDDALPGPHSAPELMEERVQDAAASADSPGRTAAVVTPADPTASADKSTPREEPSTSHLPEQVHAAATVPFGTGSLSAKDHGPRARSAPLPTPPRSAPPPVPQPHSATKLGGLALDPVHTLSPAPGVRHPFTPGTTTSQGPAGVDAPRLHTPGTTSTSYTTASSGLAITGADPAHTPVPAPSSGPPHPPSHGASRRPPAHTPNIHTPHAPFFAASPGHPSHGGPAAVAGSNPSIEPLTTSARQQPAASFNPFENLEPSPGFTPTAAGTEQHHASVNPFADLAPSPAAQFTASAKSALPAHPPEQSPAMRSAAQATTPSAAPAAIQAAALSTLQGTHTDNAAIGADGRPRASSMVTPREPVHLPSPSELSPMKPSPMAKP
jgi:hypothetical protein